MTSEDFDLFGDPIRHSSGKRGRPAHVPTQKNRKTVMMLCAMGWSNEAIAAALSVTQPTLRRHYFSELKRKADQRLRLEAWRLEKLIEQVDAGNVAALKELDRLMERERDRGMDKNPKPAKEEPLGLKERRRREAADVSSGETGGWGDLLNPESMN